MTTPPIMSVTDELIAELEAACNEDPIVELGRTTIRRLLSERAELKRDAERYRFIRDIGGPIYCREIEYYNGHPCGAHNVQNGNLDAAIDAAMTP